jgi:DNA adenine methylase
MRNTGAAPLLKWVGGKRQLLPHLRRFYPPRFTRYIEPFFGSGAVFFDLRQAGHLDDREVVLIDSNSDLIGCYERVRDDPDAVAAALDGLADAHAREGQAHYYQVRDDRFNPLRHRLRREDGRIDYTPDLAAMLIYLNRTGFNGLFRVNASGEFNVPAGRYVGGTPRSQGVAPLGILRHDRCPGGGR